MAVAHRVSTVTIILPILNEAKVLPETIRNIGALDPQPDEVLFVDGGSDDASLTIIAAAGFSTLEAERSGRAAQINYGVQCARSETVFIVHADTRLPSDAIAVVRKVMGNHDIALASFTPRMTGANGTRWGTTLHNVAKTWYAPLLLRPWLFFRGVRLLFGDHAMFFRRHQFLQTHGCDERLTVLEEADLCIQLARFGRTKLVPRWVWTSDRRIAAWGRWRANWIYFKVSMLWALGARQRIADHYPDVR